MKPAATAAIVLILLVLVSALVPCMQVKAQQAVVPHEDPEVAQSVMDALSFLTQYGNILSMMSSGSYENASRLNGTAWSHNCTCRFKLP
jgi:hypothetical protein